MTHAIPPAARDVLDFWFGPSDVPEFGTYSEAWFTKNPDFDAAIRARFEVVWRSALTDALDGWRDHRRSCLALAVVLDQFPRNMFRGSSTMYASDERARSVSRHALARGYDLGLRTVERWFFYLPMEHSETLAEQDLSVRLFEGLAHDPRYDSSIESAHRHREIVARFGRFPHRNEILARASTAAEAAFLLEPNSSF